MKDENTGYSYGNLLAGLLVDLGTLCSYLIMYYLLKRIYYVAMPLFYDILYRQKNLKDPIFKDFKAFLLNFVKI